MKPHHIRHAACRLPAALCTALLLLTTPGALASPGAHGPNGEHLDGPASTAATSAAPRTEAKSEGFELVATLYAGELSVLIDRFDTNEPVLNAVLEVESGGLKGRATFHADQGDYAIDDPQFLALLQRPGEHALVFTLAAGTDNDLLDATLVTPASAAGLAKDAPGHAHGPAAHAPAVQRAAWIGAGIVGLGLIGGMAWWRQRRRSAAPLQGVL